MVQTSMAGALLRPPQRGGAAHGVVRRTSAKDTTPGCPPRGIAARLRCGRGLMNQEHLTLCSSAEWAEAVQRWIIPWVLDEVDLGDDVLEVGPGPGLTT